MSTRRPFTDEEDAVLREHYRNVDHQALADRLGRSKMSIRHRGCRIGLGRPIRRWTEKEDGIIRRYGSRGLGFLVDRLARIRSVVCERAGRLGVNTYPEWRLSHGYKCRSRCRPVVWEHIEVVEQSLGRRLRKPECVHHINGIKTDNRATNLYLCQDRKHHLEVHRSVEALLPELVKHGLVCFDRTQGIYRVCKTSN